MPQPSRFYRYDDSIFTQSLRITFISSDTIKFNLDQRNRIDSCSSSIWGTAVNEVPDADPEIDEDESGNSYPSDQYANLDRECLLYIRIASGDRDKVTLVTDGCVEESRSGNCAIRELGILREDK
jgi:hypothetical protein